MNIDLYLIEALEKADLVKIGVSSYGWNKKSAGCKVKNNRGEIFWFKLINSPKNNDTKLLYGEVQADFIDIKKPKILKYYEWEESGIIFLGLLMEFVRYAICSKTPELNHNLYLEEEWYSDLHNSITRLSLKQTNRVSVRQDLISRRIKERFGTEIKTNIKKWVTVHGDIHWANLTQPRCWILDWESWGKGPAGLDAAFLLCFSLNQPPMFKNISNLFKDEFNSADGYISLLFACSELMKMTEMHGDYQSIFSKLKLFGDKLFFNRKFIDDIL